VITKEIFQLVLDKAFQLDDRPLVNSLSPEELFEKFNLKLSSESDKDQSLETIIEDIFNYSVNTQNPRFLNQLYGGSCKEAWLGELLAAVLNTSMATYEIAPLATLMEKELISAMNAELGFSECDGLFVPGGSYANMLGINCARFQADQMIKKSGVYHSDQLKVLVSEDAHYSSRKAVELMGLGTDSIIKVKTDNNKRMCPKDFELKVEESLAKGERPFCLVSTSGTTVWGAFDPILELNTICRKYKIWHHVDAAWGGIALWADSKEEFFKGIEKVDSITLDFHKMMASTLTKGVFITAKPMVLKKCNSGGGGAYIFHKGLDSYDIGNYAIQCGRKVDSIPLWLQWKLNGSDAFRDKIQELLELKNQFCEILRSKPQKYELCQDPEYLNICFRVIPDNKEIGPAEQISDFNMKLRSRLMERGKFMVNFSRDEKGVFFRLVLSHWGVNISILKEFLNELDSLESLL
jgi:glutamate/tyrosine decarboxylase-like PLP-dependent enzyme